MNKLMGFLELKESDLPTIPWKLFDEKAKLDEKYLWTVRTAIKKGDDLNLPRVVGKKAQKAYEEALKIYNVYKEKGIVIYYPYFIADKSGTLEINTKHIVIEAVDKDLWNLVTHNKKDISILVKEGNKEINGNKDFLNETEIIELLNYATRVKTMFRDFMAQGKSILLEWSYAYNTDVSKNKIGNRYLVFYEIRSL